jgi:NAD(P)-dependent dehydrogenase (short-subunit alcohol dehydrogenase family)
MQNWTLVTGGAKGLGAEICRTLAKEGHSLLVHYKTSREAAEEVVRQCRSFGVQAEMLQGDFSTKAATETFLKHYLDQFPETEFLVNNVGPFLEKSVLKTKPEELISLFQTNACAPLMLSQGVIQSLKKHRGAIVNIGIAGLQALYPDNVSSGYSAAKLSLFLMTKALARELAPFEVRVNMVSPGYLENSIHLPADFPMKRPGTLLETAQLVAYLLRSESRYITGQNIEIAGGVRL